MFFADRWFGFDDAIYASLRLARDPLAIPESAFGDAGGPSPKTFTTPEIRVYASDEVKFRIVDEVRAELAKTRPVIAIDGVRAVFPKGWGLVRASNTQALLVLRFEADTQADLAAIQNESEARSSGRHQEAERRR